MITFKIEKLLLNDNMYFLYFKFKNFQNSENFSITLLNADESNHRNHFRFQDKMHNIE